MVEAPVVVAHMLTLGPPQAVDAATAPAAAGEPREEIARLDRALWSPIQSTGTDGGAGRVHAHVSEVLGAALRERCLHGSPELVVDDPQLGRRHGDPLRGRPRPLPPRAATIDALHLVPDDHAPVQIPREHFADG
jgi:hypothetical protein